MVDLQTAIEELNTGKIEFDYKSDDCCTTEGEVVILLKRLAELEKENNRQKAENERLEDSIKESNEYFSEGDFAKGIACIINLVKEMVGE